MVSPNCAVIMESTSTASSYNSIERNAQSEHMHMDVGDSMDGLIENELLEEPSQDPDDEDTFSDDSLRLILSSDDEADASQAGPTEQPAAPCINSEQTTSRDKDMGLTESDGTVPFNNEKGALIHKPCEPDHKEESQSSKQGDEILNETQVNVQNHVNNMWREENRKEHTSNSTTQSAKRSGRGHSLHGRYNHSTSNIHRIPSYFNNQDNFGKPPGFRKNSGNWKHTKGKHSHSGVRNLHKVTGKEGASTPKSKPHTEAVIQIDMSNDSTADLPKSPIPASFEAVVEGRDITTDKTMKHRAANENGERSVAIHDDRTQTTLPGVNDELSRERSHLNSDTESTCGTDNSQDRDPNHSKWIGDKKVSNYTEVSRFASDDWSNIPGAPDVGNAQSAEPPSSPSAKDPPNCEVPGPTPPIEGPEPPSSASAEKDQTPVDVAPSVPNNLIESLKLEKAEDESGVGGNLKEAKLDSNNEADSRCGFDQVIETNGLANEAVDQTSKFDDSLDLPKSDCSDVGSSELCAVVDEKEEIKLLNGEHDNTDTSSESVEGKNKADSCEDIEDRIKNGEKTDTKKTDDLPDINPPLPDIKQVAEEPMEIITQGTNTDGDTGNTNEGGKKNSDDDSKNIESSEETIQVPQCAIKSARIEVSEKRQSLCDETSDQSSDKSKRKTSEKSPFEPTGGMYSGMPPLLFLKRGLPDADSTPDKSNRKKVKISPDVELNVCPNPAESKISKGSSGEDKASVSAEKGQGAPKSLPFVRKLFHRDMKGKLSKLKREELEELMIQKLVETITMRSEIGKLREQARISEHNQEATRTRCQQLSKQIKDFDMVLDRYNVDRQSNNNKPVPPIKINRSVGLQVNFTTEHGIQSLRALSASNPIKTNPTPSPVTVNGGTIKTVPEKITKPNTAVARRGIKVRSPRRTEIPKGSSLPVQSQTSAATPATLVVSKPPDALHNLSLLNTSKEQNLPNFNLAQAAATAKVQNIVMNGKLPNQVNRQSLVSNNQKPESNDLIDLTEEEDKIRSTGGSTASMLPRVGTVTSTMGTKTPLSRFQRVGQPPMSGNVAITTQSANIRVVQSSGQPTPTALVNNINAARLAYVVQGSPGTGRQLLLPPNMNQIRPAASTPRGQFSSIAYKSGVSTLANGTVRLVTTTAPAVPNLQPPPAPLPDTPVYPVRNGWKLPPPPPSLKISKVAQGIVLSWNMAQSESFADIASYQLYAYQEIPGTPPNTSLWKKVGDVRALPLPMACTLKEFTPGNNYHFAVRAVDTHSRLGQYSTPRNISL